MKKGSKHSLESKKKMSSSLKGRVSPNKGKKFSLESRKKMSDSAKKRGCTMTKETLKRNSERWKLGIGHPKWKQIGTVRSDGHGYNYIKIQNGQGPKNWKYEHWAVMENHLGKKINWKKYCIHHINEIKNDNRIENLKLMTKFEHKSFHSKGKKYWGNNSKYNS